MLEIRETLMPLTNFQATIANLLAANRTFDSYLAGGAAIHFAPNSIRYSQDLDYFHDSEVRVAEAFAKDESSLKANGITLKLEMRQPGYIRVIAQRGNDATKIEWAHDSAWRFMPTYFKEGIGFTLDPIDLATNKILALAGRDEPRDYLDVIYAHDNILALPGLVWAACGKDPGFTPNSLLELLRRKGKYQLVDIKRLHLTQAIDLPAMKQNWLVALNSTESIIATLPSDEIGALYYDRVERKFMVPSSPRLAQVDLHFATECGILPRIS
jgi:hypothetical protein